MRVCIVGCGAIGSICAAHLRALDGVEVWAYDTNKEQVQAIRSEGLHLTGVRDLHAEICATSDASSIPACDFGIIATKSFHTAAAIREAAPIFHDGVLCSLQNGIGGEEVLANHVPSILSGSTLVGGHIVAPGRVDFDTDGQTWVGPAEYGNASFEAACELATLLSRAGLLTQALEDPRGVKWSKLIFNSAANMVCALTRLPFFSMYSQTPLRELTRGLAKEGLAVAAAQNITLTFDPMEKLEMLYQDQVQHVPSTLTDVLHGRKTEVEVLSGTISRRGRELGILCPLNDTVLSLVGGLDLAACTKK